MPSTSGTHHRLRTELVFFRLFAVYGCVAKDDGGGGLRTLVSDSLSCPDSADQPRSPALAHLSRSALSLAGA